MNSHRLMHFSILRKIGMHGYFKKDRSLNSSAIMLIARKNSFEKELSQKLDFRHALTNSARFKCKILSVQDLNVIQSSYQRTKTILCTRTSTDPYPYSK